VGHYNNYLVIQIFHNFIILSTK